MTRRQELFWTLFLLAWSCGCARQHFKGREATKRRMAVERLEEDFFFAVDESEDLLETARRTTEKAFSYAEG